MQTGLTVALLLYIFLSSSNAFAQGKKRWASPYDGGVILSEEASDSNCWISLTGDITADLEAKFINNFNYLRNVAKCPPRWLYLESAGGHTKVAMAIGNLIKENGQVQTLVQSSAYCNSACILIFISGSQRFLSANRNDTSLGFHSMAIEHENGAKTCLHDLAKEEKRYIKKIIGRKFAENYFDLSKNGCSSLIRIKNSSSVTFGFADRLINM